MFITCEPWKCRLPAASSPPRRRGPGREGGRTSFSPEENKYDHDDVYDIRCERIKNRSTEAIVIMMTTKSAFQKCNLHSGKTQGRLHSLVPLRGKSQSDPIELHLVIKSIQEGFYDKDRQIIGSKSIF